MEVPGSFPNGDGLHFGGCRDVVASDCVIDAQDDAIVVRTHQEQMRGPRPCERLVFANCILRSTCNAIRFGWTGDGPIRDVSFDNVVADAWQGVEFVLPSLPDPPAEWTDPPRGRGVVPPPERSLLPFSVENVRFSNMSLRSRSSPIKVYVGGSERVAFIRDVSFSNCRFSSRQPPAFFCRPEDNVRGWSFSDVVFDVARPRGQSAGGGGVFENVRDFSFDGVRWNWAVGDAPEWELVLERVGSGKTFTAYGAWLPCETSEVAPGVRRFSYGDVSGGGETFAVRVELEERRSPGGGVAWSGTVANDDRSVRVTAFCGPFLPRLHVRPDATKVCLPQGLGRRVSGFPSETWKPLGDGRRVQLETGLYPSNSGMTMPWAAVDTERGTWYVGAHETNAAPDWTRGIAGWLLAIMRQQNGQVLWRYDEIPLLCDVAARHGLDCLGLFGWTQGGHDHLYPDYDPSDEMGGAAALKAGIAEARRRGLRVALYANGQLQEVGATKFWDRHGKDIALVGRDGARLVQHYPKFKDIPWYDMSLACLWAGPWLDRMTSLARQAADFGADAMLFDQWGAFAPFVCYGRGHGHPVPSYSHGAERPGFVRAVAAGVRSGHPDFAVFTEGLHDSLLESVAFFHAYEYGAFLRDVRDVASRRVNPAAEAFPELWRFTFPELVTTLRSPMPAVARAMASYAATFGFRHDMELRYGPDRAFAQEGRMPSADDYKKVTAPPDLAAMAEASSERAREWLKAVCDFQREHAKYLLRGRFADDEGFTCANPALVAKRFVADDGTSAVCVWNVSDAPAEAKLEGLGEPTAVAAPGAGSVDGPLAPNAIRLYVFAAAPSHRRL